MVFKIQNLWICEPGYVPESFLRDSTIPVLITVWALDSYLLVTSILHCAKHLFISIAYLFCSCLWSKRFIRMEGEAYSSLSFVNISEITISFMSSRVQAAISPFPELNSIMTYKYLLLWSGRKLCRWEK